MRTWIYQGSKQKKVLGDACPWSVGWYDHDGKRRCKKIGSQAAALTYAGKIDEQLRTGTYSGEGRKLWAEFQKKYVDQIASQKRSSSREEIERALDNFAAIVKPKKMAGIRTQTIDQFIAKRSEQQGRREDESISPATVNKELRCIKAALRVAHEWGYLPQVPKVRMYKLAEKQARYVPPEHFASLYEACESARRPTRLPFGPADWWRGLLVFAYMTGWRISECLALRRQDLDLDAATAITRAADNKGNRDETVPLNSVVVEHLRKLSSFEPVVFPWYHHERTLWVEFARIQTAAGIHLDCGRDHEHTDACHLYGFHDLRRAFATLNAANLTADALQKLMRHRSYLTTKTYVNMAKQLQTVADKLFVPPVLKARG